MSNTTTTATGTSRRYIRTSHLLGNKEKGIAPRLPVSRTTFESWVSTGYFPAPIFMGSIRCWDLAVVDAWLDQRALGNQTELDARATELRLAANRQRSQRMKAYRERLRAEAAAKAAKQPAFA